MNTQNTYDSPVRSGSAPPRSARRIWPLILLIALSLIGPIIACGIVVQSLIGLENMSRYWLVHGLVLTLFLNGIALTPLLIRQLRQVAVIYTPIAAICVTVVAYFIYERWLVAMIGV